jgi:hypothetical protein
MAKLKNIPVPTNLTELRSCRVNDGVFKAMTPGSQKTNADLSVVESACCKAVISQATALEKLAKMKEKCGKEMHNSFNEVFALLAEGIEFSCFARARTNDRRNGILSPLNDNYKHLSSETSPNDGLLFGSDEKCGNNKQAVQETGQQQQEYTGRLPWSFFRTWTGQRPRQVSPLPTVQPEVPRTGNVWTLQQHLPELAAWGEQPAPTPTASNQEQQRVGKLKDHINMWKSITTDSEILDIVIGYKLDFVEIPVQKFVPFPLRFSVENSLTIDLEIHRLLEIGTIENSAPQAGEFISNIFTRKKPNGKIRIIINLKPLNLYLSYTHFKMEHLDLSLS